MVQLEGKGTWKLAMYFENKTFAQAPLSCTCSTPIEAPAVPDVVQFELYDLTNDPLESINLADAKYATPDTQAIQSQLLQILQAEVKQKALQPKNSEHQVRSLPVPS